MRTFFGWALILVTVFGLGVVAAEASHNEPTTVPATITTTTPVPAASVDYRHYGEGVQLTDDQRVSAGVCRTFTGRITITQCVPLFSPFGGELTGKVQEDGSAGYADGWVIDSESRTFYKRDTDCYAANVGSETDVVWAALSDSTPDGLCHA